MFVLPAATLALTLFGSVSALVLPRISEKPPPPGWNHELLEDYMTYHIRYLSIKCHKKHDTQFFEDCCHPLLATETLEEARLPECIPPPKVEETFDDGDGDEGDDGDDDDEGVSDPAPISLLSEGGDEESHEDGESHETGEVHVEGGEPQEGGEPVEGGEPQDGDAPAAKKGKGKGGDAPATEGGEESNNGGASGGGLESLVGDIITGGFATFYEQEGLAGACGDHHSDDEFIAALDFRRYGDVDAKSEHCGKRIRIVNNNNGKTVEALVADACPTCVNADCVDLSHAAFNSIATPEEGMVPISWSFI